jgi:SrtB family sortase
MRWLRNINPFLIIGVLSLGGLGYFGFQIFNWYLDNLNTNEILNEVRYSVLEPQVASTPIKGVIKNSEDSFESIPRHKPSPNNLSIDFDELKKRNSDIVAWLKFDAVNIDMPIVQTTDNEFYLNHNLDKRRSSTGWVFADVRSNLSHLGFNTVLYGHNLANGQMFGSLKELLKDDKLAVPEFRQLHLITEKQSMLFEIVSVFRTNEKDFKYVKQIFLDDSERQAYLGYIHDMNEVAFLNGSSISLHDKFLTLSTCSGPSGTEKRLVTVAKLASVAILASLEF